MMNRIALALAMLSAACGVALIAGSPLAGADPFINLAPVFAVSSFLVLAIVSLVARRLLIVGAAIVGVLGPAWLMAPEFIASLAGPSTVAKEAPTLKVICANLWSQNRNYAAFEKMVAREQPDVLVLQEAFWGWKAVIDRLSPDYQLAAGCGGPHECNALVLSRFEPAGAIVPLKSWLATARLKAPASFGGSIEIASVHLSRPPPMQPQLDEIDQFKAIASSFGSRAIVAGDFNATPWSNALKRLDRFLPLVRVTRMIPSWPSELPIEPIDHIYVGRDWRVVEIRRGPDIGSDHLPIIVTLAEATHTEAR